MKGWLQEGSTLTLMGGLRGVATRLTLWLALLGGSLATGAGRHIHVDLVYRLLPKRLRLPASLLNTAAATLVCFAAVWGFFDHIAINSFGAKAEDPAGQKIADVTHGVSEHLFLTRKQVGLDLRTLPHVLSGERYDRWMTGPAWNAWVDDGGFDVHYTAEQVASIKVPDETETHSPLVVSPDGSTTRGMLTHVLGLVFPFGLFAIGLRFILRALLTLSGHYKPDAEEALKEDFGRKVEEPIRVRGLNDDLRPMIFILCVCRRSLALLGAPLFAIMGGSSELAWLTHANPNHHFLRFIAPNVMEERFADSPILVTIPLFTFVGYLMAESKAPDRIVRAASAALGWLPGGLAMVCIGASAFFTMLTGGSGVTIVAIGGLLYPTLRKQGYPTDYTLGLVTTGGSLGLLFPSLPLMVYAVVAGLDTNSAFKAGVIPGHAHHAAPRRARGIRSA